MNRPFPTPLDSLRREPTADDRRTAVRHGSRVVATMVVDGYVHSDVVIHDLSATGCRAACSLPARIGGRAMLNVAGVTVVEATVVWNTVNGAGLWFHRELSRGELSALKSRREDRRNNATR